MQVFNRYITKNLLLATVFITVVLSAVIVLTQSLRFLELIIESGANTGTFWTLTLLSLPRFWEIILPLALMIGTTFTYSRLKDASELVILRGTGFSPLKIAAPALMVGGIVTILLWGITLWGTPQSLSYLQKIKQVIQSQFSVMLIHPDMFNRLGKDFIVYVQERDSGGALSGIVIHDQSKRNKYPATILAKRGVMSEQDGNYQLVVYNGSRQSYNPQTKVLQRLDFDRYIVDIPLSSEVKQRWKQPDERNIHELLHPDQNVLRDVEHTHKFKVELHRRIATPLLALAFTMIAAATLVMGPVQRNRSNWRSFFIVLGTVLTQGLFIALYNVAKNNELGVIGMYLVPLLPILIGLYLLSPWGEKSRHSLMYKAEGQKT